MALLDDLDKRREQVDDTRENRARIAQAYATFTSEGLGTMHFEDQVNFGLTFLQKPVVSYCGEVDIEELADILGMDSSDDDLPLPNISGFVTEWDQDERGFYTGCWVSVRVDYPLTDLVDSLLQPIVGHHFTFAAVGMKIIPLNLDDSVVH